METMIPKPEGVRWSDEQWQAIAARGNNILVAAAAGSGKTAVLVERIIRRITDPEDPVDVDRLLIVTFTNAAAAEMKARVGRALEEALSQDPSSLYLRRQLSLLNRASISTLHAFCMQVLRRYYYKIGIDPAFRIADETEAVLMREEVIDALFEEEYGAEKNEAFYELVDRYSDDRGDGMLRDLVGDLYDFSRSHPQPSVWLDEMAARYEVPADTAIDDLPWTRALRDDTQRLLQGCRDQLEQAIQLAYEPSGPEPYLERLQEDLSSVDELMTASRSSWAALYEAFQSASYGGRMKAIKKGECDEDLKEEVKALRNSAKEQLDKIQTTYFSRAPEHFLNDLREMAPHIKTLARLVKDFGYRYKEAKNAQALVDYADLEHDGLRILAGPEAKEGEWLPSDAALAYREQFAEVLVDEYQDTNQVQETILRLMTQADHWFMVGDVKQSIYRFRLADPGLFLAKYKAYQKDGKGGGLRVDLAKNFRSRREVIAGTNFLFRQIMNEAVGEIDYDEDAELCFGAADYPDEPSTPELLLVDREQGKEESDEEGDTSELQVEQLEARLIAGRIKTMVDEQYEVYDQDTGRMRPVTYRDMAVIMRSAKSAAPTVLEEFKREGIPAYAESSGGYFEAIEVEVMMSLLKVIDNPHQDIPLASVLRSPIVGLDGEALAQVRIADQKGEYFDAMQAYIKQNDDMLAEKLSAFYERLQSWRWRSRRGALADLIWQIYRETGYYEFVAGMPGGRQRQANLRVLYDRARQYESTSFRGLFRFLRFVERMRDRGSDLGTARALGEQEDVVRVMTIHGSKGLEYPVVFLAGMGKQFNFADVRSAVVLDKALGFGTKYINPSVRISYPTLPLLAIKQRKKLETLAEEMRLLYVAITRAREKLFLIGTVKDAGKTTAKWIRHTSGGNWLLPAHVRADAKCYLDWVGPALMRHRDGESLCSLAGATSPAQDIAADPSCWRISVVSATELAEPDEANQSQQAEVEEALRQFQPVPFESEQKHEVARRLAWSYERPQSTVHMSKQTVSEIRRQRESLTNTEGADTQYIRRFRTSLGERPRFMQAQELGGAERGTVMHRVMQHVELTSPMSAGQVDEAVAKMVVDELLTEDEASVVDTALIVQFFHTPLGRRMLAARQVKREVPFSLAVPASVAYADWQEDPEAVLVQGVIDCLIKEAEGLVLIDYKTDAIHNRFAGGFEEAKSILADRYRVQLDMYARAVEQIWGEPLTEKYLYFFDGGHVLEV